MAHSLSFGPVLKRGFPGVVTKLEKKYVGWSSALNQVFSVCKRRRRTKRYLFEFFLLCKFCEFYRSPRSFSVKAAFFEHRGPLRIFRHYRSIENFERKLSENYSSEIIQTHFLSFFEVFCKGKLFSDT